MRVFDKIYNDRAGVLPSSKAFDLIETFGEGFYSDELEVHLCK